MPRADAPDTADVLVVGAGPAGGWLAGELAAAGLSVTLIDRLGDLTSRAFSSAALPQASLERFALPEEVIASRWSGWHLLGPGDGDRHWQSEQRLGAVLDFGRLRLWLANRAVARGAQLSLGTRAVGWAEEADGVQLSVIDTKGERSLLKGRWLVDATGQGRELIGASQEPLPEPMLSGVGVEWLLSVPAATWRQWSDQLAFFLGSDWVPQGYGWIFPMQAPLLKVGICRLEEPSGEGQANNHQPPLSTAMRQLLERQGLTDAEVIDRHGGRIRSTIHRRERHRQGRLLGLGDAVSTANLLGGEGIRHALLSAEVLAPLLIKAVDRERRGSDRERRTLLNRDPLKAYPRHLKRALGWRWGLSGRLARRTWLGLKDSGSDRRLERLLQGLETQSAATLSSLLFDYRFERYGLRALPDLLGLR